MRAAVQLSLLLCPLSQKSLETSVYRISRKLNIHKIMSEHHVGPKTHLKMYRSLEIVTSLCDEKHS
jgi:hypothetical protein